MVADDSATRNRERLQVRGGGGKGQWHNTRKTNRQEWGLILQGLDKFCSVPKVEDLCLCLLLRMKSVWWVVRMFSVSTALTKQRNTVVPFPIATLRPTHQLVAPQGRTDIRAYPSYNKKSWFDAHSVNCSVPKASASFLSNHTWQSIFSEATDTALKASHLCLSLESFSSLYIRISIHREWNHILKIHWVWGL